jgi:hypothetical protein
MGLLASHAFNDAQGWVSSQEGQWTGKPAGTRDKVPLSVSIAMKTVWPVVGHVIITAPIGISLKSWGKRVENDRLGELVS